VHIDPQGYAFNAYYWLLVGVSPAGLYLGTSGLLDPAHLPGAVFGEACVDQVEVQEGGLSSALDGNKDVYWQRRDFLAELAAAPAVPRASVFYIHGLQDWNVKPHNMEGWLPAVQAEGVPFKAWLGQWAHAYPNRADWFVVLAAWFDQFLKGRDTGILDAPRVQLQTDSGAWRHEADFLVGPAWQATFHLRADGTLGKEAGSGVATYYDYNGNLVEVPGELVAGNDRVELVSAPLERDLLVSGMPRFEGVVTASGARANLVLTLAVDGLDGTRRSINYAAQSLNHVDSLASGDADVSGQPKSVAVNFFPQDDVVRAGERLVLIAAGDVVLNGSPGPELAPLASGSTISLDLASAKLVLPVDRSITFEP
jgi:X-Pro dipeptidyl-peptidase